MNAVFIHIPKTAGGYIIGALGLRHLVGSKRLKESFNQAGLVNFGHQDYKRLLKSGLVSREFDESAFKFAFCRNPFDRVVSHYFWTRKRHPDILPGSIDFLDFTRMFGQKQKPNRISRRIGGGDWFRPQHVSIDGIKLDFIGKYENLQYDLKHIAKHLGIKTKKARQFRKTRHRSYWLYYNDESAENVRRYYRKDFDFFGYDDHLLHD